MLRIKDLYDKNFYKNNKIKFSEVKDVIINLISGRISGVLIADLYNSTRVGSLKMDGMLEIKDDNKSSLIKGKELLFSDIKNMIVYDKGEKKGLINDIIVDKNDFEIKGLILEREKLNEIIKDNEVILFKDIELKDEMLIYKGRSNVVLKNISY